MLNPSYCYIGLDFETTGLDSDKDEPIQIGIVHFDHTGKIKEEYSSFIKPEKNFSELKNIVGFITGITKEQIENAPSREQVAGEIKRFFGKNTIIIAHNAPFDIGFLQKFFPDCEYKEAIDTFPLAQMLMHYQQSYALEMLMKAVKEDENKLLGNENRNTEEESFHNALYDTQNTVRLFLFCCKKIKILAEKYPILKYFISQESFLLSAYIQFTTEQSESYKGQYPTIKTNIKDIPKLSKILPQNIQIQKTAESIDISKLEHKKKYYIGNISIKPFIERIVNNKHIILTFSNLQKLDIAKNILNEIGLKNIGFLKDEQVIDYEKFGAFLNKKAFSHQEICFIIKYYSHLEQGYGLLDLNCKSDYQIYHVLKSKKDKIKYPVVLATHQGTFAYLQEGKTEYKEYDICFMDAERRYKSYNIFLSRPLDMYYTLNFIETLLYKQTIESQISGLDSALSETNPIKDNTQNLAQFYTSFQIFIGQLFMESKNLFVNTPVETRQNNPIVTDSSFYKTNLLWNQIKENSLFLEGSVDQEDFDMLKKHIDHIDRLFNTVISIQKKTNGSDFYFVYNESTKYVSRSEFCDAFSSNVYFFSTSDKKTPFLFPDEIRKTIVPTIQIGLYEKIIDYIQKHTDGSAKKLDTIFILSTKKEESKMIFDELYHRNIHKTHLFLIENITGGLGKNIAKAKKDVPKILIGGYMFLLSAYASKIPLDEIIIFNIRGGSEQTILDDIQRYGRI